MNDLLSLASDVSRCRAPCLTNPLTSMTTSASRGTMAARCETRMLRVRVSQRAANQDRRCAVDIPAVQREAA